MNVKNSIIIIIRNGMDYSMPVSWRRYVKIFFVLGKSCSGKDTIFRYLKNNKELNLKTIVGYTTRPMREGEQEGVEYHFVSREKLAEYRKQGKIIECRDYDTGTECGVISH